METTSAKSPLSNYKNTAIIVGVVVVVAFLIVRIVRAVQKANEYNNVANDPAARLAFLIRQACNPWGSIGGISAIDIDGTDETELFALATQVKDLNAVRTSYKKQFSEELLDRLAAELSRESLDRWLNLAGGSNATPAPIANKSLVYAKQAAPMYDATDSTKVVKTLQNGELAGTYVRQLGVRHSNGQTYQYIEVTYTDWWVLTFKAWIRKDFVKIA
ncbi:hypothetical protein [Runella sp. SP2]|uniref:hypothetical protein n=1 Tax=Runella sp. SP2 TaxID=2268026 RepID=UPI000F073875|nr:hypothetical protein [Runella sp. SP2]AYQ31975.1 hypothetical protein DTQ70_07220 [Runella sp. SP2]